MSRIAKPEGIQSFHPEQRVLMGPGPSDVSPRVLSAMARPTLGHLDPQFIAMMNDTKALLQYAFQTSNPLTMPVSAPGSAGMETCFTNLVENGDKVVVCQNGVFGGRMKENVERCGATAIMVEDEWGRAIDLDKVNGTLEAHPDAKILAFVHAETSTGAQSDAQGLARIARQHDCLTIADAVTSLGGTPLLIDDWDIDAVYSGSQKCLSCTPGLSPISISERATKVIQSRQQKVQSWFLDLNLVMGYWGDGATRSYHHTAPVNALYGLHESLVMLAEEGLENAWNRHQRHHLALRAGLEVLGLKLIVPEKERLPQLNAIAIPEGIDDGLTRKRLLTEFKLEIGAGLGPMAGRVWRIGLMGHAANGRNVRYCIGALAHVLNGAGHACSIEEALTAVDQALADQA